MKLPGIEMDPNWTLFLDRDGVINVRLVDAYVRNWDDWEWSPGAKEAIAKLAEAFAMTFVVTNQRGIARGLMTEADLALIHARMRIELGDAGARLTNIYHCPHDRDEGCECRKPGTGMVRKAIDDFPAVVPEKSLVVGDSISDMEMAFAMGMRTVFVGELPAELEGKVDLVVAGLPELADQLS